jgi:Predicted acyltransferase
MTDIELHWARLEQLSTLQFHAIIIARQTVFIAEQHFCCPDSDAHDTHCWHLSALYGDKIAAYLRVIDPGEKYPEPSIGRLLTTQAYRRTGLGKRIMQVAIANIAELYPGQAIRISAQAYLQPFYANLGFATIGKEYLEEGIPHLEMLRLPNT